MEVWGDTETAPINPTRALGKLVCLPGISSTNETTFPPLKGRHHKKISFFDKFEIFSSEKKRLFWNIFQKGAVGSGKKTQKLERTRHFRKKTNFFIISWKKTFLGKQFFMMP